MPALIRSELESQRPTGDSRSTTTSSPDPSIESPRASRKLQVFCLLGVALFSGLVFFYQLGRAPLTDWDEAWHAQVSSEILSDGDWLTLHHHGEAYFNKPPLTFWLRALAFKVAGVNEAAARFWPALFGWGTVLAIAWFFGRIFDTAVGTLAALILTTSWLFCLHHAGRSGETDGTLIFFNVLTYAALWRARTAPRWFYAAGFFSALGWMTKGGTAYLPWIAAILLLIFERPATPRRWRHLAGGFALSLLLTLPWQAAMLAKHGRAFVNTFYIGEGFKPALQVVEDHPGTIGFYPMLLHAFFQPWFSLAGAAALWAIIRRRNFDARLIWLLSWALVTLLAVTLFSTKMTWYATPALPALAVLAAVAAVNVHRRYAGWILIAAAAGFAIYQMREMYWATPTVSAAIVLSVSIAWMLTRAPRRSGAVVSAIAALCLVVPLALHMHMLVQEITTGEGAPEWTDVDMSDEPWREVCDRIAREHPGRAVLLADIPMNPAAYFYLHRLPGVGASDSVEGAALAERLRCSGPLTVITRREIASRLESMGLRKEFSDRALVVFEKRAGDMTTLTTEMLSSHSTARPLRAPQSDPRRSPL